MSEAANRLAPDPRLARRKTSEDVIEHLVGAILSGRLRAGDRIDIDQVGEQLGVSRIPVREALLLLERDGLVESPYHRPVHVAQLDEAAFREHFELYGLLGGAARRRMVLLDNLDEPLARLKRILAELEATPPTDVQRWEWLAREFLAVIHHAGAGRRLRSMLASFRYVLPYAYGLLGPSANKRVIGTFRHDLAALRSGDGERAAAIVEANMRYLADLFIAEMRRIGVLSS